MMLNALPMSGDLPEDQTLRDGLVASNPSHSLIVPIIYRHRRPLI